MKLHCKKTGAEYQFVRAQLSFEEGVSSDKFGEENSKTVRKALSRNGYAKLRETTEAVYPSRLDEMLGDFLLRLKKSGDNFYRDFLNCNGDEEYSTFKVTDKNILGKRGVYAYKVGNELRYIGRCLDSIRKRVNQGHGKIYPKNCYLDGRRTNCRINALITKEKTKDAVSFWFCELAPDKAKTVEKCLINEYTPQWNKRR
ncbi:MAG: hypothetical protein MPK11_05065 [Gammaproteobacteria bacterium]|nr:hypothetical protein [Gammaproteobacteria bacterium]CAJ2377405.1 MAG: GIY-YIG domain-containing protein [Arenicellales bacterium IbO2]MDA7961920.1 hypothetical protein [Gammaproteobacteria bacterium]MDA7970128.1 hypothetical protein [Gammaproteobacteria bacterium]MDA7995194.1 hypothetical protein [Gammaproteobacteria bacterium]